MIGIIGAMQEEVNILRENINAYESVKLCGVEFYLGNVNDKEVVLCQCAVGKVNAAIATTILINEFNCDFIINTGIAGGIKGVTTKDIVIGSKLRYHDLDVTIFNYEYGQVPGLPTYLYPNLESVIMIKKALLKLGYGYKEGTIFTGDQFVSSLEQLKNMDLDDVCIAEMEGVAIAHVCVKSAVDFMVLRYISDVVGAPNQVEDFIAFESEMAQRSAQICLEVLHELS